MTVDVHRTDDDALMIDLQAGRREAFDELVARHQGALIGFFFRNTRDAQLSEDLAQETLLRVYNQAWDYLPRGTFRGWMFRIARNLLIDNSRRRSHDALVKAVRSSPADREDDRLSRVVDDITAPVVKADQKELADLVEKLLYNIPEEQRLTFLLHHFAGLSLPEIADALETNVPTAKSRLRLAREKLRDQLAERGVTATMIAEEET